MIKNGCFWILFERQSGMKIQSREAFDPIQMVHNNHNTLYKLHNRTLLRSNIFLIQMYR